MCECHLARRCVLYKYIEIKGSVISEYTNKDLKTCILQPGSSKREVCHCSHHTCTGIASVT